MKTVLNGRLPEKKKNRKNVTELVTGNKRLVHRLSTTKEANTRASKMKSLITKTPRKGRIQQKKCFNRCFINFVHLSAASATELTAVAQHQ